MHLRKSKQIITKLFAQPLTFKSSLAHVWLTGYSSLCPRTPSKHIYSGKRSLQEKGPALQPPYLSQVLSLHTAVVVTDLFYPQ